MKKYLLLVFGLCFAAVSVAQDKTINGTVTSEEGETLPGVNIVVKGTTIGTVTDVEGTYTIQVPQDAEVLVFSFIGLASKEVAINNQSTLNVVMNADVKQLSEVVVVAYGEQSKRALTGALDVVDQSTIEKQQVVSVGQALQGVTPGVNIINSTGQPGDNPTIRIRGISSVNASAEPLIVLDGVPYNGNLNSISPQEIESMTVLKDAASSALYGSRAANGVIMITTKSGKGEARINFSTTMGVSDRAIQEYDFLSSEDYVKLAWESLYFEGVDDGVDNPGQYATDNLIPNLRYNPYSVEAPILADGTLDPDAELRWNTDWEDLLTNRNALRRDYSLTISGGQENIRYFIAGSYLKQEGNTITSEFDRINARLNLDSDVKDWLTVGLKSAISSSDQNYPTQAGTTFANNIQYIRSLPGIYPLYQRDDAGDLILDEGGNPQFDFGEKIFGRNVNQNRPVLAPSNLVGTTLLNDIRRQRFTTTINTYLEARFLNNFSFRTNFALDKYLYDSFDYDNPDNGAGENVNGRITRQKNITTAYTWTNQLKYDKVIGEHQLTASAIGEIYSYKFEYLNAQKTGVPFNGLKEFNSAASLEDLSGYTNQERLASLLGRVSYSFKDKYFLEVSGRADASSRFAKGERLGTFLSGGASWVFSEEDFLAGQDFLSFGKIRASYGELGNRDLLSSAGSSIYFPYLSTFDTGYDDLTFPGIFFSGLANPLITWEKVRMTNIALDFGVMNDRITGTVEWYNKITDDLLFDRPLPPSVGVPEISENIGQIKNTGIEVSLTSNNIQTSDFNWVTNFNVAFEQNEITELPQDEIINGSKKLMEGKSIYDFFIQDWAGVDPADGMPMWYMDTYDEEGNVNGRTTTKDYDEAGRYYVGSSLPWARGGLSNVIEYKGFDFSFLFNYSLGGKVLDYDYSGLMHGYNRMGYQIHSDIARRWQKPGDETDVPRLNTGNSDVDQRSTRFLFDNSYVRLRNVTIGYDLGSSLLKNMQLVRTARIFIQADNYLTWTKNDIKGLDPEQNIQGTTDNRSSMFKTLSVGLNVGF